MDKKERLNTAFKYLRNQGFAETQKEVAEKMGSTAPNVSSAMRGVDTVLTDKFLLRFNAAFGNIFSDSWLTTGEGEMLVGNSYNTIEQKGNNNNNNNQQVDGNIYNSSEIIVKLLEEMAAQREAHEAAMARKDAQIERLLALLENKQ